MSIEVNGVTLPDIPSEVLAEYPYAVIVYLDDSEAGNLSMYFCFAGPYPFYCDQSTDGGTDYAYSVDFEGLSEGTFTGLALFDGDESWSVAYEELMAYPCGGEVDGDTGTFETLWSNHDIYVVDMDTGEIGEVYFANSAVDPNYYAPKSWYDGMARQVMRLTGTSDKLSTDAMLAAVKAVEVGGGLVLADNERIYQIGAAVSTLDISGMSFESSAS